MLDKILKNKKYWILGFIIIIGIFLRTYRFHDWLEFQSDEARDATLIHEIVTGKSAWPLLGPWMGGTGINGTEENSYRLGPIYYYFQIISAKIFGDYPDKLAYPDLLFSILSIPLFYLFFKKYFSDNLSLGLAGLYAFSFFAVRYARFAWNPNSIPFFILLFLLALHEFIANKEKIHWFWAVILGMALGIGVQLHAITLILFPVAAFFVFLFSINRNWKVWKKWVLVFIIFAVLNLGQIISETRTNFANSKILLKYFSNNSTGNKQENSFLFNLGKEIDCQIEANSYMLSSLGRESCSLNFIKLMSAEKSKIFLKSLRDPLFDLALFGGFIFSFFGYWLLAQRCKKEEGKSKKYFLRLIALYLGIAFLIILAGKTFNFRYFNCIFFAPFLFLGFFIEYLSNKFPRIRWQIATLLLLLAIIPNAASLAAAAKDLSETNKTGDHLNFLIQTEPIAAYLVAQSNGQKKIFLGGKDAIMQIYYPLDYFMKRQNIALVRISKDSAILPSETPSFSINNQASADANCERIGKIFVCRIKN